MFILAATVVSARGASWDWNFGGNLRRTKPRMNGTPNGRANHSYFNALYPNPARFESVHLFLLEWVRSTPHPVTVTTKIMTFLVGNPEQNLHLPLASWVGGRSKEWGTTATDISKIHQHESPVSKNRWNWRHFDRSQGGRATRTLWWCRSRWLHATADTQEH